VAVPNVVNQTRDAAIASLATAKLRPGSVTDRESAVPVGLVIEQNPAAGATAEQDSTVDLVLSRGPGVRLIPNLVGQSQDAATRQLQDLQLTVTTTTVNDLSQPAGTVVGTNPAAGTSVPTGSTVTLQVVSGSVTVPNVVGQSQDAATGTLSRLGLRVTVQQSGGGTAGQVTRQSPGAGARIGRGGTVTIVVPAAAAPPPSPKPSPTPSPSKTPSPTPSPSPSRSAAPSPSPRP
jgi:serine/threonine-protein kinase